MNQEVLDACRKRYSGDDAEWEEYKRMFEDGGPLDLRLIAHHEAAHAVVHTLLGIVVEEATIIPTKSHDAVVRIGDYKLTPKELFKVAVALYAAEAADRRTGR